MYLCGEKKSVVEGLTHSNIKLIKDYVPFSLTMFLCVKKSSEKFSQLKCATQPQPDSNSEVCPKNYFINSFFL